MDTDTRIAADWTARANARMKALMLTYTDLSREAGYASFLQTKRHLTGTSTPEWMVLCAYARALKCSPEWLARAEGEYPTEGRIIRLRAAEAQAPAISSVAPDMGLRFRAARLAAGLNQVQLAKSIRSSKQLVSKLELGEVQDPHCRVMFNYEDATGYNARWLVLGRGPELRGGAETGKLNADILDHATRLIDEALTRMRVDSIPRRARTRITSVLYDRISGGQPPDETLVDTLVRAMG